MTRRFDYLPWTFAGESSAEQQSAQQFRQQAIGGDTAIGERCYVADSAAVFPDRLRLGADSYIAAGAYVTGELTTGTHCTLNPSTTVRGKVTLGTGVRIGAHSALLGFNHSMAPDRPVFQQPHTSVGITVGDDVWIGSHVIVVDGVTIGDHCVIGAGAVVTKDLAAWTVAAGNPARPLRDRRDAGTRPPRAAEAAQRDGDGLRRFADAVRAQAGDVLARSFDGERYVDRPGSAPTMRAHCDAVEIADLLLGTAPVQFTSAEHAERLAAAQDPATGLVPEIGQVPPTVDADGFIGSGPALYHTLCVGYALDLLGSRFPHQIRGAREMTGRQLIARLEALPWRDGAWEAGAWIDSWASAAHWNLRRTRNGDDGPATDPGAVEALFGWLLTRADPWTGLWGSPSAETGRLQQINGYYRLTRGSFAQYGLPVPHPNRLVDAVLDHARDQRHFSHNRLNACNVLDVAHPLWLSSRQIGGNAGETPYRAAEIRAWAQQQLATVLPRWQNGEGFGFALASDAPNSEPGLQGTEMWLTIIWLLTDLLGRSEALRYRPRGIHRPEPAPVR